jgi:hypothetical protein
MRVLRAFALAWGVCLSFAPRNEALRAAAEPAQAVTPNPPRTSKEATKPHSSPNWDLSGIVVDESGAPVARATVRLRGFQIDQGVESTTDGHFVLNVAKRPVFLRLIHAQDAAGTRRGFVKLTGGSAEIKEWAPVRIVLKKPRQLSATVTDKSAKPVAGAIVAIASEWLDFDEKETDSAGKVFFSVPDGLPLQSVLAVKPGLGIDYVEHTRTPKRGNKSLDQDEQLKFVLGDARTVTVHVTDRRGQPLAGARVSPQYVRLPKKQGLNIPEADRFTQTSDSQGNATFRYIPADNFGSMGFQVRLTDFALAEPVLFNPKSKSGDIAAVLLPLVPVHGRVITAEGRPAVAADVEVNGTGYGMNDFHTTAKCDNRGEFDVRVAPDKYYTFSAHRDRSYAALQSRTILDGAHVAPLTFTLKMGTRIHGRVLRDKDKDQMLQSQVFLYLNLNENEYSKLPKDEQLPNPKNRNRWIGASFNLNAGTDQKGEFEFYVPPGHYTLHMSEAWDQPPNKLEVTDQAEICLNLTDNRPSRSVLKGRVVLKTDPNHGVPEANVEAASIDHSPQFNNYRNVADREGKFELNRLQDNLIVWAREGSLAGAVRVGPNEKAAVVELAPTASATGLLVDDSGRPLVNRTITCGVQLPEANGPFSWYFGGTATTDAQGRFTIINLTGGLKYVFEAVVKENVDGPQMWHTVATRTPKEGERVDLGDLKLTTPRPYAPPTLDELIRRDLNVKDPYDALLEHSLVEARLFDTNVLLLISSPRVAACRRFLAIVHRQESDPGAEEAAKLMDNFTRITLDDSVHHRATEIQTFLKQWNLTVPPADEALLVILNGQGHLVAATSSKALWPGDQKNAKPITAFLKEHLPPVPDAQKRLADAIAQAKRENKRVLVEQSASWCHWCHVLARHLDQHRSLVSKDYVWITIDPRFSHGEEIINKLRPKAEGGIPWMVILDADGKPLITSDGPGGNIGYPGKPKESEHFEKMLRTTARHLSDAEIKTLVADALKK